MLTHRNLTANSLQQRAHIGTSLSGQAQYATAGNATILAWVNLAKLPSVAGSTYYIAGRSQFGNDLDLQYQSNNGIYFYTDSSSATSYIPNTATLLNQYHFIAATLDTTTGVRSIYFDGSLAATQSNVPTRNSSTTAFTIGDSAVFTGRNLNGSVDEVALYNSTLTAAQIQTIYNASLGSAAAPEPGSIALLALSSVPMVGGVVQRRYRRGQTEHTEA